MVNWAFYFVLLLLLLLNNMRRVNCVNNTTSFSDLFNPSWAPNHIIITPSNQTTILSLDSSTGCGFESKKMYLFGKVSAQVKLIEGDSAGTVTAFYMASSEGPNHDELDFEFLGNLSGEPYIVQTNVYVNGTGNREQRHYLWFDPTQDFHTYAFSWNPRSILFLVDGIPIREFRNNEKRFGVGSYPKNRAMGIHGSLWNADDWATQGGKIKTNWTHSPFVVAFQSFQIQDACQVEQTLTLPFLNYYKHCQKSGREWDSDRYTNKKQKSEQLKWVRDNFLVYDYCQDIPRFYPNIPKECTQPF